jgi:hypothetical protein
MLLDMEAELQAMRALVLRCAVLGDRVAAADVPLRARLERELRDRTPLVKWFGAERTLFHHAQRGAGPRRLWRRPGLQRERHYRDALILPIYEGTSQIQALMSLKDQVKWALERKASLLLGPVRVEATPDTRGDALREMAAGVQPRAALGAREEPRARGPAAGARGRAPPARERFDYALLSAERLCAMLAYTRAAEALVASSTARARACASRTASCTGALPLLRDARRVDPQRRPQHARGALFVSAPAKNGKKTARAPACCGARRASPARPRWCDASGRCWGSASRATTWPCCRWCYSAYGGLKRSARLIHGRGANIFTQWVGDPDAIGSAVMLRTILQHLGAREVRVLDGSLGHPQNRSLVARMRARAARSQRRAAAARAALHGRRLAAARRRQHRRR